MEVDTLDSRRVAVAFDILAERHDSFLKSHQDDFNRIVVQQILETVLPSRTVISVLDAGGGTGYWAARLARLGHRVTLVDVSRGMLSYANQNLLNVGLTESVGIACADALHLPFPNSSFDVVLALGDLLNYVPNPVEVMLELRRTCIEGGFLVATAISRWGLLLASMQRGEWPAARDLLSSGHFTERTEDELRAHQARPPLDCRIGALRIETYSSGELVEMTLQSGWRSVSEVFPVGVLSSAVGRENMKALIRDKGLEWALGLESELRSEDCFRDLTKQIGFVARV